MKKIVIFGSFVVDLMSRADHLPVKGETVFGSSFKMGPGGKGSNQAVAAKRAGADVRFVTKLGADMFGALALETYRAEGIDTGDIIVKPGAATGSALIMVSETTGDNQILVVPAACNEIEISEMQNLFAMLGGDCVFMTQLETNYDSVYAALEQARAAGCMTILNPAPMGDIDRACLRHVDIITPNEVEAAQLTGVVIHSVEDAKTAAEKLLAMGPKNAVITLGSLGALVAAGGEMHHIPRYTVPAVDTTGAGDAFNGGFACALGEGKSILEAAYFASAVAALSVTKIGTAPAMPLREEVNAFLQAQRG